MLGGAAAAWPIAARAQQAALPVIGFLNSTSPDGYTERLRGFRQGLKDAGYVERENVAIEYRWAENKFDRLPELAAELVRRPATVIVATNTASAMAAKAATTMVPIAFITAEDPVRLGLVASLARPGGNLTGINFFTGELAAKQLELLRELVPAATRVAVLVNPANVTMAQSTLRDVEAAARTWGCKSKSSRPAAAATSIWHLQPLGASGPTPSFSASIPFKTAGVPNWSVWRRATQSLRHFRTAILQKSAG